MRTQITFLHTTQDGRVTMSYTHGTHLSYLPASLDHLPLIPSPHSASGDHMYHLFFYELLLFFNIPHMRPYSVFPESL